MINEKGIKNEWKEPPIVSHTYTGQEKLNTLTL
jgi:hypothetical protein